MENCLSIVMAAGQGKRMKSDLPKVLHSLCGVSMIERVLSICPPGKPCVVVGAGREQIIEKIGDRARYFVQERQLGTGHAVMTARDAIKEHTGYVLVLAGDMPLLTKQTIDRLIEAAVGNAASMLVTLAEDPTGYGRVLRDASGAVCGIVEHRDANDTQRKIREINASVYCFDAQKLLDCLNNLGCDNTQGEYYLTDCIGMLAQQQEPIAAVAAPMDECLGVNDRVQLAYAESIIQRRINHRHMINGVTMRGADQIHIEESVAIGNDTLIEAGAVLMGRTVIGKNCHIMGCTRMTNASIGDGCIVMHSMLANCTVGDDVHIGPFANLRPDTVIGNGCRIGDFMELKNAKVGNGTKMAHLSYVGDAVLGSDCNIGCGVTFANYDGKEKYQTQIGDNCFIGCNVNLVAPVQVEDGAYIAAGTTVTKRVSADALCIGRTKQSEIANWAKVRREQGRLK